MYVCQGMELAELLLMCTGNQLWSPFAVVLLIFTEQHLHYKSRSCAWKASGKKGHHLAERKKGTKAKKQEGDMQGASS